MATFSARPCCPLFYGCSKKHDLTYKENRNLVREQLFDNIRKLRRKNQRIKRKRRKDQRIRRKRRKS